MKTIVRLAFGAALLLAPFAAASPADAHSGGLDSTGGHHCRQAGYDSGKCSPLNSYHCHSSTCSAPGTATTKPTSTPTTARATTTTVRRTTTTQQPPTTTTEAPTTTTTESTTTTSSTTTSSTTTTSTTVLLPVATPAAADKESEAGPVEGALVGAVLAGMGYGGYRLLRKARAAAGPTDAA